MDSTQITTAALKHAEEVLGASQYRNKKAAVKAIAADFEAGAEWALQQLKAPKEGHSEAAAEHGFAS